MTTGQLLVAIDPRLPGGRRSGPRATSPGRGAGRSRETKLYGGTGNAESGIAQSQLHENLCTRAGNRQQENRRDKTALATCEEMFAIVQPDVWITADFKETQLRRMHHGQLVTIHVDAFGRDFNGYVEAMPARAAIVSAC